MPVRSKLTAFKLYRNRERYTKIFFCAFFATWLYLSYRTFKWQKHHDRGEFRELFGFQLDLTQIVEKTVRDLDSDEDGKLRFEEFKRIFAS